MRQFQTSTLEQRKLVDRDFETHPLEVAWASEAIFFVDAEQLDDGETPLSLHVQLSVDGVNWLDEGTRFEPLRGKSAAFKRISHFGGWLRLVGRLTGDGAQFKVTIHLVVKE